MHKLLKFRNHQLLLHALSHRSYVNENPDLEQDNERLEFLGDALLNFLAAEYLYNHPDYPGMNEDEMTRLRAALVEEKQFAQFALDIGLDTEMLLGKGLIREGGYENPTLLSGTFEALVGAYFLDRNGDFQAVRDCVLPLFQSIPIDELENRPNLDYKSKLQEWIQSQGIINPPLYKTQRIGGADHAPEFLAKVFIEAKEYGQGIGRNKKEAEKQAAKNALDTLAKLKLVQN